MTRRPIVREPPRVELRCEDVGEVGEGDARAGGFQLSAGRRDDGPTTGDAPAGGVLAALLLVPGRPDGLRGRRLFRRFRL